MPLYNPVTSRTSFVPLVVARQAAAFTLTNNAFTNLVWDTEVLDTENAWDGTSFTTPTTGIYAFELSGAITPTGTITAIDISADVTIGGSANSSRRFGNRLIYSTAITPVPFKGIVAAASFNAGQVMVFRIFANFTGATALSWGGSYASLVIQRLQ